MTSVGYFEANRYLNQELIRVQHGDDPVPNDIARGRREQMLDLLPLIGNPQEHYETIQVAGTSGKGTVSTMLASMLYYSGCSTGLHLTPFLQVATEKLWADGYFASDREFVSLIEWIKPFAEELRSPTTPMHAMASVAITLEFFRRKEIDVAVMETGVGGRKDITNVCNPKVAVITNVGMDHLKTLGPTIDDIAWHKAGIIAPGSQAVIHDGVGVSAARKQADSVGAPLRVIDSSFYQVKQSGEGVTVSYSGPFWSLDNLKLGYFKGRFQGANVAVALAALEAWDPGMSRVSEDGIRQGLQMAALAGRHEWIAPSAKNRAPVLLDGAHNEDKLSALLSSLREDTDRQHVILFGALKSKDIFKKAAELSLISKRMVITSVNVYQKEALDPRVVKEEILKRGGDPHGIDVVVDPFQALEAALDSCDTNSMLTITGSMYLVGELRGYWYSQEDVLSQRTSWPASKKNRLE